MKKLLILFLFPFLAQCQNQYLFQTPSIQIPYSVFNDIAGWWRADTYTGSAGGYSLTDKSGNGNNMSQQAGTITPGTAANGQAKFTGNSSAYLNSNLSLRSWPVTIITVGKRTSGNLVGFFGHQGSTSYNTLWYGYEASDQYSIYAVNRTNNTTSETGADAVYMARIGYGSRVPFLNGLVLTDQTLAGIVRSSSQTTSIGTQYRGLNMDWYETLVWDRTLSLSDIDEVNTYLNTRYGLSLPLWSSYTSVNEICFHGQSNSDGRGDRGTGDVNIPSTYRNSLSNVFTYDNTGGGTGFQNMNLSTNTFFNPLYIGQELTAAKDYADASGHNVYVFKAALGSTSMSYQISGDNGYWTNIHDATTQSDSRSEFSGAMHSFWLQMRAHQQASRIPTIKGLTFYQGEDDATDVLLSTQWSATAQEFFRAIRAEMGLGTFKVFLVRIHKDISLIDQPYRDTVRAQQDACAAVLTNCQEVSVDSYSLRSPGDAHIDVNGQIALGQFLATQY